jgi:hypothetical protein
MRTTKKTIRQTGKACNDDPGLVAQSIYFHNADLLSETAEYLCFRGKYGAVNGGAPGQR